jgi:glycosyltransferase involved in cell wall biosynthesis
MPLRLAVIISHPTQHFAPWHREIAKLSDINLRVFFCCDWGSQSYFDKEFQSEFSWDIPLLEGYEYEFLPIRNRPSKLNYWQVDNPGVVDALDRFAPDIVKVFGYAHKTNWRAAEWAKRRRTPLLIYSDSNGRRRSPAWKRLAKQGIVKRFYRRVDGALFVGDNNRAYHSGFGIPDERLFPGSLPIDQRRLIGSVPNRDATRRAVRRQHGIPDAAFVVLFCGKYSAKKRPLDVIVGAQIAAEKGIPVWSLLVGEGPLRNSLETYCRDRAARNCVLTGFVNQSSIAEFYVASDVLAVSSEDDAHPLVVSEAATFGLPVIVSDRVGCIGPGDTARPEVNAIVYPWSDRDKLAAAIHELQTNISLYHKLSIGAEEIARTQDVTTAARELEKAAQRLMALGPR